jgi:hypothetical protein
MGGWPPQLGLGVVSATPDRPLFNFLIFFFKKEKNYGGIFGGKKKSE